MRRILVTRLRFLGDVVLSTPVLAALRRAHPEASIEYLTFAAYAPALWEHPHVDRLHALPDGASPLAMARMAARLARPRVDWWIDLFGNPRSALLCALARPRVSVGPDRGLRSRVFTHRRGRPAGDPSAVRHHLEKLRPLLGEVEESPVRLRVSEGEREAARKRFHGGGGPPVLLHPGATWPSKAWPEEKWPSLAADLRRRGLGPLLLLSAPGQEALSRRLAEAGRVEAAPALPLRELLALVASARAYVGNDGGILHCAVALGTPTVGLFGPTEAEIWFPHARWGKARLAQEAVPCRPCHLHHCGHLSCLRDLPAGRVGRMLQELLESEEGAK